jgi:putative salt-induced outer membrane protein
MRSLVLFFSCFGVVASAFAQTPEPAADKTWSGDFSFGLALTQGNSDTKNVNLTADAAQRLNARNVLKYDAFYLRADSQGELTVDRTLFGGRDEYTISPLTYGLADVHFLRDRFKEIDYLINPTVGAGHHFIKTDTKDLAAEGGVGVIFEKDKDLSRQTSGSVNARQLFAWKFTPTATFGETATGLWKTKDFADALYHIEASLASNLTTRTQLKLSALDDYKTKPPRPGIKKNDFSLIAAVAMKF